MTLSVKHAKVVASSDSGDGKVSSNAWNDEHVLKGTAGQLVGFGDDGLATEIDPSSIGSGTLADGDHGDIIASGGILTLDPTLLLLSGANNLSELSDPVIAMQNLGGLQAANNLSELASKLTALANLGLLTVTDRAASYTATLADAFAWQRFTSSSAQVFTIPPNSSVAYPVGTELYFSQSGTGSVTVAGGAGVTVNSPGGVLALSGQYSAGMAKKLAAPDTWIVTGDIGGGGTGTTTNAVTFTNTGGAAVGATFDGSAAKTIDYSTVGAQPSSPRIQTVTSSATVTPTFLNDQVNITAQAVGLTLANPSGTAVPGKKIVIRVKDNATAQSIAYGTQYRAIGVTLPTTTVISKTLYLGCIWNDTDTKLDVVAVSQEA